MSPKYSLSNLPTGASSGRIRIPSCSSLKPNSNSEQSIPSEAIPRIFADLSFFSGRSSWYASISKAPESAKATLGGGSGKFSAISFIFGAPVTSVMGLSAPNSTSTKFNVSAFGCLLILLICPTTQYSPQFSPIFSITSTSSPAVVRRSASASGVMLSSTKSCSQLKGVCKAMYYPEKVYEEKRRLKTKNYFSFYNQ